MKCELLTLKCEFVTPRKALVAGVGGGSLTSLMRVGRAKLETDRIIMQDKDTGLKTQCQMMLYSSDRLVAGGNGKTRKSQKGAKSVSVNCRPEIGWRSLMLKLTQV